MDVDHIVSFRISTFGLVALDDRHEEAATHLRLCSFSELQR